MTLQGPWHLRKPWLVVTKSHPQPSSVATLPKVMPDTGPAKTASANHLSAAPRPVPAQNAPQPERTTHIALESGQEGTSIRSDSPSVIDSGRGDVLKKPDIVPVSGPTKSHVGGIEATQASGPSIIGHTLQGIDQ